MPLEDRLAWYKRMAERFGYQTSAMVEFGASHVTPEQHVEYAGDDARIAAHFGNLALQEETVLVMKNDYAQRKED